MDGRWENRWFWYIREQERVWVGVRVMDMLGLGMFPKPEGK